MRPVDCKGMKKVVVEVDVTAVEGNIFEQWRVAKQELLTARTALDLECRKVVEEIYRETGQLLGRSAYLEGTSKFISHYGSVKASDGVVTEYNPYAGVVFYLANTGFPAEYGKEVTEHWDTTLTQCKEMTATLVAVKELARELFLAKLAQ